MREMKLFFCGRICKSGEVNGLNLLKLHAKRDGNCAQFAER